MSETRRITYPISPDYVAKGWTVERALAELIANALDEDGQPTITCDNKVMAIEDTGEGLRSRDLVLGISSKSDSQVGQFGEGLKLSAMILARSRKIKKVVIETAGFTLTPVITKEAFDALGDDDPVELLAFDITTNTRKRGTKVSIHGVDEKTADKVKARFLALADPSYRVPQSPGRLLVDRPGEIYVLGVYVQEKRKAVFGYDLANKRVQNRDRTIVEGWALQSAIRDILCHLTDPQLIRQLVDAALAGKLGEEERSFLDNYTAEFKPLMKQIGAELYEGRQVCFQDPMDPDHETLLDLQDRGYELVSCDMNPHHAAKLFRLLGVRSVASLRKREPRQLITEWLKPNTLETDERETLERAVVLVKRVFGDDVLGKVDAYETTREEEADEQLHWGGFYQPSSGRIGIQRRNLASFEQTLEVLLHECAHRILHRARREFRDRTREFEAQLGRMGAKLAIALCDRGLLEEPEPEAPAEETVVKLRYASATPSGQARKLVAERLDTLKIKCRHIAVDCGLKEYYIKRLRTDCGSSLYTVPTLAELTPVCDRLGLDPHPVWLGMFSSKICASARDKAGKLKTKTRIADMEICIAAVEQRGGDWVKVAERLRDQIEGRELTPSSAPPSKFVYDKDKLPQGDEAWLEPYTLLIAAERERVAAGTSEQIAAQTESN